MKVKPTKLFGAIVILFLFVVIGYGVTKALVRPGPRQLEQMERDKILEDPEVKAILAWEKRGKELNEQAKLLPPFKPPDDGIVTPDQMRRYMNMIYYVDEMMREDEKRRPKGANALGAAMFYMRKGMAIGNMAQAEQVIAQKMTTEEYKWIDLRMKRALALAIKRLHDDCYGPEKPEEIVKVLESACIFGRYSERDEKQNTQPRPDLIDPSEIPEIHYRYILQYQKWIRYTRFPLDKLDMSCLMERDDIQHAPFTPPEVNYPEY